MFAETFQFIIVTNHFCVYPLNSVRSGVAVEARNPNLRITSLLTNLQRKRKWPAIVRSIFAKICFAMIPGSGQCSGYAICQTAIISNGKFINAIEVGWFRLQMVMIFACEMRVSLVVFGQMIIIAAPRGVHVRSARRSLFNNIINVAILFNLFKMTKWGNSFVRMRNENNTKSPSVAELLWETELCYKLLYRAETKVPTNSKEKLWLILVPVNVREHRFRQNQVWPSPSHSD